MVDALLSSAIAILWISCSLPSSLAQDQFASGQTIATAGAAASISSGSFSLGFAPSPRSPGEFELGIWYRADSQQVLVWDTAAPASRAGAILQLSSDGSLAVRDGASTTSWTSGATGASSGQLQESGNLALRNSSGQVVWSSFDHPSSTLLPGQFLPRGRNLTSRAGGYTLTMDQSGNLTLRWRSAQYWSSDTDGSGNSSIPTNAVVDVNGVLNLNATSTVRQFFPEDYGPGQSRRLTLDDDGNLRLYTLIEAVWSARWQAVSDQCQVYNYCGNYGICSYRAVPSQAPVAYRTVCDCPTGLGFVDPSRRNAGCTNTGNVASDCATESNQLIATNSTAWLDSGSTVTSNSNSEQCTSNCRGDSSCFGCLVPNDGSGHCVQFRSTSMSGYSSPSIQSTAFLKVCTSAANSPPTSVSSEPRSSNQGRAIGIAVGVTVAALVLAELAVGWAVYRRRYSRRVQEAARHAILDYASGAPMRFTYKELQNATYNFQTRIGEGGFGPVYKGSLALPVSKTAIAVKKLEGIFQGEKEFRTEVATIGSTHHMNLMRLVGFCAEGAATRLLVYEFLPNGSLDRFLFHHDHDLEWGQDRSWQSSDASRPFSLRSSDISKSGGQEAALPSRSSNLSRSGAQKARSTATASTSLSTSSRPLAPGEDEDDSYQEARPSLDWPTRFKIALGTARALAYLHEECREPIVHCDLKPENILLDDSFAPKVSDFGLARLIDEGNARNLTTVRGTRGYMAPEWLANMPITAKSDVYSYGMVLLELVGGRRNFDTCRAVPRGMQRYPAYLYRELEAGRLEGAVDERMYRADVDGVQLERVVKVAFWCIQDVASARPVMSKVVQMLEGNLAVLLPPPPKVAMDSSASSSGSATAASSSTAFSISSQSSGTSSAPHSLIGR
ncbi:G-type lectin S-receptor-like serine/threonine-protein kinase At1g34300 [Selaginella moellendorffii]|uniref:G-type lectin S-receptor-like serine/threonine-protein kinase At1g34300 n=1 Tax=Selaginella moellendorffii TaxID=88036 RepID=UPI000D1CB3AC|nr:G-type lectin S-receptor-like serine/threonine-protein kinase At1g34300 [Selaginella moellendorffii]|eukprot:XP_024517269.1 G-type lectin S-receptor-like serine/threonine-protein kinase At1g34300 [Selaginella moellendorffii]